MNHEIKDDIDPGTMQAIPEIYESIGTYLYAKRTNSNTRVALCFFPALFPDYSGLVDVAPIYFLLFERLGVDVFIMRYDTKVINSEEMDLRMELLVDEVKDYSEQWFFGTEIGSLIMIDYLYRTAQNKSLDNFNLTKIILNCPRLSSYNLNALQSMAGKLFAGIAHNNTRHDFTYLGTRTGGSLVASQMGIMSGIPAIILPVLGFIGSKLGIEIGKKKIAEEKQLCFTAGFTHMLTYTQHELGCKLAPIIHYFKTNLLVLDREDDELVIWDNIEHQLNDIPDRQIMFRFFDSLAFNSENDVLIQDIEHDECSLPEVVSAILAFLA